MTTTKGIILAAGLGSRLHPATLAFGKPFLPIFDKPMIYYPLCTLMQAGIRDILIVTSPRDRALFEDLLGDGAAWGISVSYAEQPVARGIADAFILGRDFIGQDRTCLILGDNFFYGDSLQPALAQAFAAHKSGATVFCYDVENPSAYGVADIDADGNVTTLVEKPESFVSHHAITGLYLYDSTAYDMASRLKPSKRGELEITDLNIDYLAKNGLAAVQLDRDIIWFDVGTHDNILAASQMVQALEKKTGKKVGCPYETAFGMGFIDRAQLHAAAVRIKNPAYHQYLLSL